MNKEIKKIDNITDLRNELKSIPRVRLQFAKAMTDLLHSHHISVSGDLLGKLNIAHCEELEKLGADGGSTFGTWTN
ncbi:hypothetical protein TH53_18120 [Pedobacter lusitanus]|uniref:Uncharacterized protein n=1 Tax=Pedobacter lusitanus TaxID=1503925 RepID=A0A0D0GEW3_9SPHI|nr:hypothetical protein [Pedobacter lusitanus]KIO75817.1 hypothetical protein TH53_18120 [Pedobacter lusitanus]